MLFAKKLIMFPQETSPYVVDEVIFEQATAGNYTVNILTDGKYEVYVIGGGAGGVRFYDISFFVASGGSGAGFIGVINIDKGNHSITVGKGGTKNTNTSSSVGGGGNSSIDSLVIAYAAGKHDANTAGAGGAIPSINTTIISQTLNVKGNNGTIASGSKPATQNGGASVYGNYGKGGNAGRATSTVTNGTAGYVKIVYKGK